MPQGKPFTYDDVAELGRWEQALRHVRLERCAPGHYRITRLDTGAMIVDGCFDGTVSAEWVALLLDADIERQAK